MVAPKVIVFGPTGDVASIAARVAQEQGAKVFLAMRNTQKSIQGLSLSQEAQKGFQRVQADLTQPESITTAIKQTGATTAFMYLAWEAGDHMKATFEASKAAGVRFMVFLSSFTIPPNKPLDQISPENRIPYMHARAEMELRAVYGPENYVALRPGAFAANTRRWRTDIKAGMITLDSPETIYDYITPIDMGKVAGTILATGQRNRQNVVYLYGPQLMTQKDALKIAVTALGKNFKPVQGDGQERHGNDNVSSQDVIVRFGPQPPVSAWFKKAYDNFQEGAENVGIYTGQSGTSYQQWVEDNVERFDA